MLYFAWLALLLVPLEMLARWHYADRELHLTESARRPAGGDLTLMDIVQPARHRDLVYELRPSLTGRFLGVRYQTNALGMRDAEVVQPAPHGTCRIALLGDSFSFAWGVDVREGFADLLEPELSRAWGGRPVEVLNFGVPGYNTALEAACLERKVLPLRPDLVIVQYYYNDAYLPNFVLVERPHRPLRLLDWIADTWRPGRPVAQLERPGGGRADDDPVAPWRADPRCVPTDLAYMVGQDGVERALRRIKAATDAAGIPLLVFLVAYPAPAALADPRAPVRAAASQVRVERLCDELGVPCVDTLRPLVEHQRARGGSMLPLVLSGSDWHPNAAGHRLFARVLAEALLEVLGARATQ